MVNCPPLEDSFAQSVARTAPGFTIRFRSFAQSLRCGVSLVGLEEPLERSGVWICFRPKSWASIDQAPGPTIAKLTPRTASMIGIHGSPGYENAIHTSAMANRQGVMGRQIAPVG